MDKQWKVEATGVSRIARRQGRKGSAKRGGIVKTSKNATDIKISNPDKVFWPDEGYTKKDLGVYYAKVFPWLEPYVRDRVLTMERCPDGMQGQCFYQKEMPKGMPAGTPTKRIPKSSGSRAFTNYVVGDALDTQMAKYNFGC